MQRAMGGGLGRIALLAAMVAIAVLTAPSAALALGQDAYEPDDSPGLAGSLTLNQPEAQDRTLHGFDVDFVRVEVQAGVPAEFVVTSRPGLAPARVRMTLWPAELAGGGETWSLASTMTGFGAGTTTLSYTPTETGELYLQVEAMDFADAASYWLAVYAGQDLWDEYENADLPPLLGTGYLCGDSPLLRSLMPDDLDWIRVWVPAAGEYQLRTGFSSLGTPPDTTLEVWDASGTTLLAWNDNDSDGGPLSSVNLVADSEATMWRVRVTAAGEPSVGAYTFSAIAVPSTMGKVFGTVAGPDGEVAGGALVEMLAMDYSVLRTTRSRVDGTYSFDGVPFGEPFRVRADIEGAGLVPDLFPATRHLANPETVEGGMLDAGIPDLQLNLRVRRPWVSGFVFEAGAPYSTLPGMRVTVFSLDGVVLGAGTTGGSGNYYIELPPFTTGECKVEVRDPSGLHTTMWWYDSADADSAAAAGIPTFGGLSLMLPLSPELPRDVVFELGDVCITFDEVTSPGTVTATPTSPQNLPAPGFRMVSGRHYDIHPTLGFSGGATITVAIPAEEAENAAGVRLFHWEGDQWVDVTTGVDTADMTVSGRTTTFSEFSLQSADDAVLEATSTTPTATFVALLVIAVALTLRSRRYAGRED